MCSLYVYINDDEYSRVAIFVSVFVTVRIIAQFWLWSNFHDRNLLCINATAIPIMMIHISYINNHENLRAIEYSIPLALCLHTYQIAASNIGFDSLQMVKVSFCSDTSYWFAQYGFRIMETLSRVGALMILHLVTSDHLGILIYLIVEIIVCFGVQMYFFEEDYKVAIRYCLLWALNIPELSSKTLGTHWARVEIRKLEDDRRKLLAQQFQETFEDVYNVEKNYKFAIGKTFESFTPDISTFVPFPPRPTWAQTYINCFWDWPFIKACAVWRILNNAILIAICYPALDSSGVDKQLRIILLSCSVVGSVLCPIFLWYIYPKINTKMGFYIKEKNHTVTVEELFELDGIVNKAHLENFIVLGKDLNALTNDGELLSTLAARHNNIEAMNILLHAGIDINKSDSRGYTPLMVAVMLGNMNMIKLMLEYVHEPLCCCGPSFFDDSDYGIDIDKKLGGAYEGNAVIYTAPSCDVEILSYLEEKGGNVHVEGKLGNVLAACFDTEVEVDKVEPDEDGNWPMDYDGNPVPLIKYEDLKKKTPYIKKCVALGVNPNMYRKLKYVGERTLLWRAINGNKTWLVHLLLDEYEGRIKVTNGEKRNETWVNDASHLYIHTPDYKEIGNLQILRRFIDLGCDFVAYTNVLQDGDAFADSPFYECLLSTPGHDPDYLKDLEWFLKEIMTDEIKQYLKTDLEDLREMRTHKIELEEIKLWNKYVLTPGPLGLDEDDEADREKPEEEELSYKELETVDSL